MRVFKPNFVTPMPAVFDDGQRLHCVVTAIFHATFDGELCEERHLWAFANEEVEGMVLDEGMPKPKAEWLVHGSCYAQPSLQGAATSSDSVRNSAEVRQSFVKVRVGDQEKILAVFGKRTFKMGVPSTPEPFDVVPIRFTHAFGGEGFADNPAGKGFGGGELPQIEVRGHLIQKPADRPPVAGFGRIDVTLPRRTKKTGTYDTKWFKTRYPGTAEDFDASYFQLSAPDQWRKELFQGTEDFSVVNMHPEKPQLDGRLPGVIARCFVKRSGDDQLVEVPMRIDTVHLFPHLERQVIVCRGVTTTKSDLLGDIDEVAMGLEWIARPKTRAHYEETFSARRTKKGGALASIDDTPLLPEMPAKVKPRIVAPGEGLKERRLKRKIDHEYEKAKQSMVDNKIDLKYLPPKLEIDTSVDPDSVRPLPKEPPTVESVNAQIAEKRAVAIGKLRAEVDKASAGVPKEIAEQLKARSEAVIDKLENGLVGPPSLFRDRARREIAQNIAQLEAAKVDATILRKQLDDEGMDRRLRQADEMKRNGYRKRVQYQRPAPALGREASEQLRTRVRIQVEAGEAFEGLDLTGADLSGLDLRGANLRGGWLESVDLTGANLEGANLENAVLARTKLAGADLRNCKVAGANFSEADLSRADLSGQDLSGCFFVRSNLTDTKMANTNVEGTSFGDAKLVRTDLSGCKLKNGFLINLRFEGVSLRDAVWDKATLYQCDFIDVDARRVDLNLVLLVDSMVERTRFDDATLTKFQAAKIDKRPTFVGCSFVGAHVHLGMFRGVVFDKCSFNHSDFEKSDFSGAIADGSTFEDARGVGARFVSASVRGCKFDRADLMSSFFGSALMDEASFEGTNLFRSDFGRSVGANVSMAGANVKRVRTVPKREETA